MKREGVGGDGVDGGVTHCPPNSCIPSRANTTMKRKRRKSRLMMDFMELRRETTRFLSEFQYLRRRRRGEGEGSLEAEQQHGITVDT